jgi:hypothetical protein
MNLRGKATRELGVYRLRRQHSAGSPFRSIANGLETAKGRSEQVCGERLTDKNCVESWEQPDFVADGAHARAVPVAAPRGHFWQSPPSPTEPAGQATRSARQRHHDRAAAWQV